LVPGIYSIGVDTASFPGFVVTDLDQGGDDALDNDIERGPFRSEETLLVSGENDPTWDIGIFSEGGDEITNACACKDNATDGQNGQFDEVVEITATPGGVWRVVSQTGMFLSSSAAPPALPTSVPVGTVLSETSVGSGIYNYEFIHVDSLGYTLEISDGTSVRIIENLCAYPEIFFTEIDTIVCLYDDPIELSAFSDITGDLSFDVLNAVGTVIASNVDNIDPELIGEGSFELVATITPADSDECENRLIVDFSITISDDCLSEIGDFVWEDVNADGQQDDTEPGIQGVTVMLMEADGITMVTEDGLGNVITPVQTDENGFYEFVDLIPGTYRVK